jgi:hypothetical protein
MANAQITAGFSKALHDQKVAAQYAHDPVAYWQSIGGTLPPGVSAKQFAGRIGSSPLHKAIVDKSTGRGQMSVLDSSPCGACIACVQFMLDAAGVTGAGIAAFLIPGIAEWIAGYMAAGNVITIGTVLGGGGAGIALGICKSTGKC